MEPRQYKAKSECNLVVHDLTQDADSKTKMRTAMATAMIMAVWWWLLLLLVVVVNDRDRKEKRDDS